MGLIHYVIIAIGVIVLSVIFLVIKVNKSDVNNKPSLFSLLALGLIISNWIVYLLALYVTDSYIIIPGVLGDYLFIPLWFIVSIVGLVAAYKEHINNKSFSIVVTGLALINAIVGMVLWGLSKM